MTQPRADGERNGSVGEPVCQVRGILAERVIISTALDPFMGLRALADYSGLGRKTLLRLMARDANALPHYRLSGAGKIVVRVSDFNTWMEQYRHTQSRLDELVEQRRAIRAGRRRMRAS